MLNDNGITKVEGNETKRINWENVSNSTHVSPDKVKIRA